MCLQEVLTKEEFEEKFGPVSEYGYKVMMSSGPHGFISCVQGSLEAMPIGRTVHKEDYSEDVPPFKLGYEVGFHIWARRKTGIMMAQRLTGICLCLVKVKIGEINAYGIEFNYLDNKPMEVVVCETMTIMEEVNVPK